MDSGFFLWYVINECSKSMEKDEKVMEAFNREYDQASYTYSSKKSDCSFYLLLLLFVFLFWAGWEVLSSL